MSQRHVNSGTVHLERNWHRRLESDVMKEVILEEQNLVTILKLGEFMVG